jgi:small subunit ribosomal protein S1
MGVDRKNRAISLSIKAKDQAEEREAMDNLNQVEETGLSAMAAAFKNAKN